VRTKNIDSLLERKRKWGYESLPDTIPHEPAANKGAESSEIVITSQEREPPRSLRFKVGDAKTGAPYKSQKLFAHQEGEIS
jgi:hypothetical protein